MTKYAETVNTITSRVFGLELGSSVVAGFVTVLVGFASSAAIVFQAAEAVGATQAELASWFAALGAGMGVTSVFLSIRYRAPIVTAWSTPGAALLTTSLVGIPMAEAIGAFMVSATLIVLFGAMGWFERAMDRVPMSVASALLAGILVRFGMDAFASMNTQLILVASMFGVYLVGKCVWPRYTIVVVLATGSGLAWSMNLLHFDLVPIELTMPVFTAPAFSWNAVVGVAIPLFVVTMTSQNIPGVAVIRASGYSTPISPLITWTGMTTLALAPFGCFALNLAAITAAICTGDEAHKDPSKRYLASVAAGVFYVIVGVLGAAIAALLVSLPKELIMAVAGLALLGTIAGSLNNAMKSERDREAAAITFLVASSGVSLFGIGAAFWGLVVGSVALVMFRWRRIT